MASSGSSALARARAGDHEAFEELTGPYRRELHVHCYRMLGSLADAEDAVQETLTSAWRGLEGFREQSTVRTWLYRISTNRCLNAIRHDRRRRPPEPVPPFRPPEPTRRGDVPWLQPYPDALLDQLPGPDPDPEVRYGRWESIELGFLVALQRLPPRQVAALLLGDVLGFSNAEIAHLLDTGPTAVKGILQRARATMARARGTGGPEPSPAPASPAERSLARRFADAYTAGDVGAVIALLSDDAWLAMPPAPHEYHGHRAIRAFLEASTSWRGPRRVVLVPTGANGSPAFGCYLGGPDEESAAFNGVMVVTVSGARVSGVTRFLDATLATPFGLASAVD